MKALLSLLPVQLLFLACLYPGLLPTLNAASPPAPLASPAHAQRVHTAFEQARNRWTSQSNNVEAAWQFGRWAHDWADFSTNDHQRAAIAELGIAACRHAITLDPKSAPAHYYLALDLSQLTRTKLLGAFKLIEEMEHVWTTASTLDPHFDFAGAHRSLGILYRDAPGWPASVGSEKKSRFHLQKAVELHPEYPGNRLTLFEGYLEWGDKKLIRSAAAETDAFLQKARATLTGERWALEWLDWDHRWHEIKRRANVKDEP